ncbi:MAG: ankyrin repeat domain-containing protein [Spiribacter salinus]|uniref:Ankyrin repeat domain-containing protein n=1 Tax=Spiribacter salinus TaxID=1335746 RepID=A0A540VS68_9GAMM|nr:MAG: ankyrin repeat domain-containing protein [Spiribacter salinus]
MMNARSIDRQPTKLWRLHQQRIAAHPERSLAEQTFARALTRVETPPEDKQRPRYIPRLPPAGQLLDLWEDEHRDEVDPLESRIDLETCEKRLFVLGLSFLRAAEDNDLVRVTQLLDHEFPVNFQNPRTLETALHSAAARSHRGVIRALVARRDCDYLAQDFVGRFPFNTAYFFGNDPAIERLLLTKARKRARAEGLDLFRAQMELLEKWAREDWYNARAEDAQPDIVTPTRYVSISPGDEDPPRPRPRAEP